MRIPFIGGAYEGRSKSANAQTCVNLYVEPDPTDPEGSVLVGTPGHEEVDVFDDNFFHMGTEATEVMTIGAAGDLTEDANVATMVLTNHGFITGQLITIANANPAGYDVASAAITRVDDDTFRYAVTGPLADNTDATVTITTANDPYLGQLRAMVTGGVTEWECVVGNRLFTITKGTAGDWVVSHVSAQARFLTTTGPIAVANIGEQADIIFADGVAARIKGVAETTIHTTGAVSTVMSIDSNTCTEMDGYLIRDNIDSKGQFIYSALYDATIENPFSYATTDGSPDDLLAVVASGRQLFLFGELTTEIWYNSGDANNPFARFQGGFSNVGCAAPLSAQRFAGTVAWLGRSDHGGLAVYRMGDNFNPIPISTPQVTYQINQYGRVFDAYAYSMNYEGHEWYVLTFPEDSVTWVYDATSKNWHKWQSGTSGQYDAVTYHYFRDKTPQYGESAQAGYGQFGNRHIIGKTAQNGKLYELKSSLYADDGAIIYRERTSPHFSSEERRVRISDVQLDIEEAQATRTSQGSGTLSAQEPAGSTVFEVSDDTTGLTIGDNVEFALEGGGTYVGICTSFVAGISITCADQPTPAAAASATETITWYTPYTASLEWSKDGGQNFNNRLQRSMGVSGEDRSRLMWRKLGLARNWVFRFKTNVVSKVIVKGLIAKLYGEPE
jgi:hypothetical protein